jgi:CDP-diacylglycerol--glycerol-3-phosphate 3-phosphatidyltransferase
MLLAASIQLPFVNYVIAVLFVAGAVTDCLDGFIARRNEQETILGKFLDPVVDKILVSAGLVILVSTGCLQPWIAVCIVGRELLVTGLRALAASRGVLIPAGSLGKIKTVTQYVAVIAMLLRDSLAHLVNFQISSLAMYIALVMTIWSGLNYFIENRDIFKTKL